MLRRIFYLREYELTPPNSLRPAPRQREARINLEKELKSIKEEKAKDETVKKEKEEEYEKFKDFVAKGWTNRL